MNDYDDDFKTQTITNFDRPTI